VGCRSDPVVRKKWMKRPDASSRAMCVWVSRVVQAIGRAIMGVDMERTQGRPLKVVACLVPCPAQMASVIMTRLWTDMRA
jgi:hypothetical protein